METIEKRTHFLVRIQLFYVAFLLLCLNAATYIFAWGHVAILPSVIVTSAILIAVFSALYIVFSAALVLYLQRVWRDVFSKSRFINFFWLCMVPGIGFFLGMILLTILAFKRGKGTFIIALFMILCGFGSSFAEMNEIPARYLWILLMLSGVILYPLLARVRSGMADKVFFILTCLIAVFSFIFPYIAIPHVDYRLAEVKKYLSEREVPLGIKDLIAYSYKGNEPNKEFVVLANDKDAWPSLKDEQLAEFHVTDNVELMRELFDSNKEFMKRLDDIFKDGSITLKLDETVESTSGMSLPSLTSLSEATRLYSYRIRLALADGNKDEMMRLWRISGNISQGMFDEPVLISALIGISCEGIRLGTFIKMLESKMFSEDELIEIEKQFEKLESEVPFNMKRAIIGEAAWFDVFELLIKTGGKVDANGNSISTERPNYKTPYGALWYCFQIDDYMAILDFRKKAYNDIYSPSFDMLQGSATMRDFSDNPKKYLTWRIYAEMGIVDFNSLFKKSVQHISKFRMARLASAVERYRIRNGKLPETLEDIDITLIDPLTDAPYKYENGKILDSNGKKL